MKIIVRTKNQTYPIYIESGLLKKIKLPRNSIIITDQNVKKFYSKYFSSHKLITIPAGETSKKLKVIEQLAEKLLKLKADRQTTLIALGGGVVGDITGFLASVYMRGVPFIQIPTTLLAMVDASVGGKTGVDLKYGKNLLGTFYQPQAVYIDPIALETLPAREFNNGMAEVIKHGIIDGKLFYWLQKNKESIINKDKKILEELIYKNCLIKKRVVEQDEKEKNIRAVLNLGHTYGHAMEKISNYKISHGYAVAIGLVHVAGKLPGVIDLLKYFNLPATIPDKFKIKDILKVMRNDKKNKNNKITLIIPKKIGHVKAYQIKY